MNKTINHGLKANRFLMTLAVVMTLASTPALAEQNETTRSMDHSSHQMNHKNMDHSSHKMNHKNMDHSGHKMNHKGMDHSGHKKR